MSWARWIGNHPVNTERARRTVYAVEAQLTKLGERSPDEAKIHPFVLEALRLGMEPDGWGETSLAALRRSRLHLVRN